MPAGIPSGLRLVASALVAAAVAACLTLLPEPRPAWACSCVYLGDQSAFDDADVVFRGEFIGYDFPPLSNATSAADLAFSSADLATWTFAVREVYKGEADDEQDVVSAWSGASCGLELPHEGEFYVFARRVDAGLLGASLCGGTRSVGDGPLAVAGITPQRGSSAAAGPSGNAGATSTHAASGLASQAMGSRTAVASPTRDRRSPTTPDPAPEHRSGGDANESAESAAGGAVRLLPTSIGLAVVAALLGAGAVGLRRGKQRSQ